MRGSPVPVPFDASFRHRLSHLLGWFEGHVVSWTLDGRVVIGFQCHVCGDITGVRAIQGDNTTAAPRREEE